MGLFKKRNTASSSQTKEKKKKMKGSNKADKVKIDTVPLPE